VTNVSVGDTVTCHLHVTCGPCRACRAGDDMHCENVQFPGLSRDGGFADLLKTSARSVVKLDPVLKPKDIAALADAGLTAYHAVRKSVPLLRAGTKAVVIGAGGLGHIGIQCLKALIPVEIIVTDPNEKALELAREWGADETVKVEEGYVGTVLEMIDGKGAEVVFDYVGERGAEDDAWKMTRNGSSHYVIGYGGTFDVPTIDIISTERNVIGILVGTYNDLAKLMNLTARGLVTLHTSTYPLDGVVDDAIQDLNSGNLQGRGILVPEGAAS
jgi:NAD+-dependent secondary alcohol dehydrogenase Adh1